MYRSVIVSAFCLTACQSSLTPSDSFHSVDPAPSESLLEDPPENRGWVVVWSDEFDSQMIDRTKWQIEESCWGGGNEERQCYVDWPEAVSVENGLLRISAYRQTVTGPKFPIGHPEHSESKQTQKYVSGKVLTKDLAFWTYGRFSARIKLPAGQGTWPAFWMLPQENVYGGWASSGEIDIMEAVNLGERCDVCNYDEGENRSSGALHFGGAWPDNTYHARFAEIPGSPGAIDDYHVYSVEWGEGKIHWYVDDKLFYSLKAEDWFTEGADKAKSPTAPFDQDFYVILNLAVGGKLSETNNRRGFDPDSFPANMLIDWVRVYQCENDDKAISCMQNTD